MLLWESPNGAMKVEIDESVCTCSHRLGSFLFIVLKKKQQKGNNWLFINVKGSGWDGKGTKLSEKLENKTVQFLSRLSV